MASGLGSLPMRAVRGGFMKRMFTLLVLVAVTGTVYGQMRDNTERQLSCNNSGQRFGVHSCEVRESTLGPSANLQIEPGHNGGITVKGWSQNSVLVRAAVETWAATDSEARTLASQVRVDATG